MQRTFLVLPILFGLLTFVLSNTGNKKKSIVQARIRGQLSLMRNGQDLMDKVDDLKKMVTEVDKTFHTTGVKGSRSKVVYTRWGKDSCRRGAKLLYSGYAAGSHYTHKGGGSNVLCLTDTPQWYNESLGKPTSVSYVYGAEYQTASASGMWKMQDNHDVPCAVCTVRGPSAVNMMPGRPTCMKGWRLEYNGYLMSEYYGHHRSSFTCVDKNPESVTGGHANQNGLLFYFAVASCGSLKCPPYVGGREITCAVCSS